MQLDAEDTAHALRVLHAQEYRERAMGAPQIDIEEATGVSEAQARREAEAGGIAADRLRSLVDRIERMHEEIKALLLREIATVLDEGEELSEELLGPSKLVAKRAPHG